jgi:SprT-like zinc ribbon domain
MVQASSVGKQVQAANLVFWGADCSSRAQKVTSSFRNHEKAIYRRVEVTTKHSYQINHKYLWVCIGTPPNAAKDFLNLPDEDGCGAEYGRHSKSIDPERHRCGKCKGVLVQVRPKPRKTDPAKKGRSPFKKRGSPLERLEEAMEFISLGED